MVHPRYYSTRLDRDLISQLYRQPRTERVPMTALASRLVRGGLADEHRTTGSVVTEEPAAFDSGGRKDRAG
jgi:hypothetical protein